MKTNFIIKFTNGKYRKFSNVFTKDIYKLTYEFCNARKLTPRYINFYNAHNRKFITRLWFNENAFSDEDTPLQPSANALNTKNLIYHNVEQRLINDY